MLESEQMTNGQFWIKTIVALVLTFLSPIAALSEDARTLTFQLKQPDYLLLNRRENTSFSCFHDKGTLSCVPLNAASTHLREDIQRLEITGRQQGSIAKDVVANGEVVGSISAVEPSNPLIDLDEGIVPSKVRPTVGPKIGPEIMWQQLKDFLPSQSEIIHVFAIVPKAFDRLTVWVEDWKEDIKGRI